MANQQQAPITTIPPFTNQQVLPACATDCGALYDANGACVPPAVQTAAASAYEACFCRNAEVSALSTTMVGVCDGACDEAGMSSLASWFRDMCSVDGSGNNNNNNGGNGNNGGSGNENGNGDSDNPDPNSNGPSSGSRNQNNGGGGDWISGHWQWVVMIAVLVVAIAGIWVGACIWRRRYLKKKDQQTTWDQKQSGSASRPSWGPGEHENQLASRPPLNSMPRSDDSRAPGVFMPGSQTQDALLQSEKPQGKKRWFVKERT